MQGITISSHEIRSAWANIGRTTERMHMSIRKLSSGSNQNASENPQSIPFVERLKSSIAEAAGNINKARDMINMHQARLSEVQRETDVLMRIKELAVAYNNDTLADSEKADIQAEVDELSKIIHGESKFQVRMPVGYNEEPQENTAVSEFSNETASETIVLSPVNPSDLELSPVHLDSEIELRMDAVSDSAFSLRQISVGFRTVTIEKSAYDLSEESTMSKIDKEIENYAGIQGSLGAEINSLEKQIEQTENSQIQLNDMLNRYEATDIASETSELMKSKTMREISSEIIKAYVDIEKHKVLALLTA